jgi:hypothetical protein
LRKKQSLSFGKGSIPMVAGSPIFDTTPNPSKLDSTFGVSSDYPLITPPTSAPVAIQTTIVTEKASPTQVQASSPSCQLTLESREINNAGGVRSSMYCKSTIPTRQTCPPPLPLYHKQLGMSQDDIISSIVKSNTPSLRLGQLQRSRSAEAQKGQTSIGLKRSSSGGDSTRGQGYCDAPSFSFGPEFNMPDSQPWTQCTPSVASYGDDVHVDVGLEGIDPEELERLCVEAELAHKKPVEQQNIGKNIKTPDLTHGKTETPPDNFKTPIRDVESGVSSIVGGEGSSIDPHTV